MQNAIQNVSNVVVGAFSAQAKSAQLDPFSRRATRPMVYWNTKQQRGGAWVVVFVCGWVWVGGWGQEWRVGGSNSGAEGCVGAGGGGSGWSGRVCAVRTVTRALHEIPVVC